MNLSEIEHLLLKDKYLDIAFQKYLSFKNHELYDESYKAEILSRLNHFFAENEVTPTTIVDITKKLQKENPQQGSFVHWSNPQDLVRFAESHPEEVSELMNQLLDDSIPLEKSIEEFREKGKAFDPKLSLGAPLFGYILASFDLGQYPLYKQEIFKDIKQTYGINLKFGSVGLNYEAYVHICNTTLNYLKPTYQNLTILDIQDFFYCSSQYDQIRVESAVEYLYEIATELHRYKQNVDSFLQGISEMNTKHLEDMREMYRDHQKVNQIKFKVLDTILEEGTVTLNEFEQFKQEVNAQHETNILQAWTNFTILFQVYYFDKKDKVLEEQRKIHEAIRNIEEYQEIELVEDRVLKGFNWNNNFGGSRCWLAVYESNHASHRTAPQLFLAVDEHGVQYGLYYGDQHVNNASKNEAVVKDVPSFTYEDLHHKMVEVKSEFLNNQPSSSAEEQSFKKSQDLPVEQWSELIQNDAIFKESDFNYLGKMYEWEGEASATRLAHNLDKHPSAFNTSVAYLAKRILEAIDMNPPLSEEGEAEYWPVLFTGYRQDGQFIWSLKPNLKRAMELTEENWLEEEIDPYTKEDFLKEVFMEREKYTKIKNLLAYKKNLIFQGPPGVGKTFVSKRLAFSLMGEKDESRVEMVQFHQSYAYDDFVMGYRPKENGFDLEYGVFYDFCQKALEDPGKDYYFIIDEINRGNLSKIFGELFMLIESDKRDEYVTMGYSKEKFTVPGNVHLIGTMNTADRSLAQIEVALRRRFAFVTLKPVFNDKWEATLKRSGVSDEMVSRIESAIKRINDEIISDFQLGEGYAIGHSFFTSKPNHLDEETWYEGVIQFEIIPLLEEYYFDRPEVVQLLIEGI
ncbi:AAA family ATPase [Halobacillus yeomjeoni]|uniref:AAA family ATPase n=1 Tax=Halobacillus yeomjeoni TaxID=311194 RepID=UPI001CD692A5|nr:AAA family ATPase [Halobacillus yeomjeoni]MCA0984310.1 AAA family ATPase [Halobacillus yeomjeoni]